MKKSKVIFLIAAAIFLIIMALIGYDISSKTTFPGSKPQLKERLMQKGSKDIAPTDSTEQKSDSLKNQ